MSINDGCISSALRTPVKYIGHNLSPKMWSFTVAHPPWWLTRVDWLLVPSHWEGRISILYSPTWRTPSAAVLLCKQNRCHGSVRGSISLGIQHLLATLMLERGSISPQRERDTGILLFPTIVLKGFNHLPERWSKATLCMKHSCYCIKAKTCISEIIGSLVEMYANKN